MAKTKMKKIEIVAEIGWNHMGNINLAERMIKWQVYPSSLCKISNVAS